MQGYKTWIGLLMIILGWLGFGEYVSETQAGTAVDAFIQLVGVIVAVYGNYNSHREIKAMGGYRK